MKTIFATNKVSLPLGRQGEDLARQVVFSLEEWQTLYGPGIAELIYQRPNDERPYIMEVQRENTSVVWSITSYHTADANGAGKCELRYYPEEGVVKSRVWNTFVEPSMDTPDNEVPPSPESSWVDAVLKAGAEANASEIAASKSAAAAKASAKTALETSVKAPIIGNNGNWFLWDTSLKTYVDTGSYSGGNAPYIGTNGNWFVGSADSGVKAAGPQGPRGEKGDSGVPGANGVDGKTPIKGTDYWTEADQQAIIKAAIASLTVESWTFELENGTTLTKDVLLR